MSLVTTVILTFSPGEVISEDPNVYPALEAVNRWLIAQQQSPLCVIDPHLTPSGGTKMPQAVVAWGAYNYIGEDALVDEVWLAPWKYRDEMVLVMYSDFRDKPSVNCSTKAFWPA